jgi:choline dehydrogenase-like flavoprotein
MLPTSAWSDVFRINASPALHLSKTYDAIVIGAGATGGMAALLTTEAGMRVLVLEAGMPRSSLRRPARQLIGKIVQRLGSERLMGILGPNLLGKTRAAVRLLGRRRQPIQSRCFAWERAPDAFVDDIDCPYTTPSDRPFIWLRARLLGGRMAIPGHGRQYYRLGPNDLFPVDGLSPPWPLRSGELDQWYAAVERRLAIAGTEERLSWLPDSELATYWKRRPRNSH